VLTTNDFAMSWDFKDPRGKASTVRVGGRYACDNWEVLREWALAGLGIALKSTWDVYRHLQDGSLVALFPGYSFHSDVAIYAVYPHRRHLPAKTRVFIEFLAASFGPEPYWDRAAARGAKPRIKGRPADQTP
jgi:DNA-binding transcriptional LysR family regulator